jgi:hypothetical protein
LQKPSAAPAHFYPSLPDIPKAEISGEEIPHFENWQ